MNSYPFPKILPEAGHLKEKIFYFQTGCKRDIRGKGNISKVFHYVLTRTENLQNRSEMNKAGKGEWMAEYFARGDGRDDGLLRKIYELDRHD